MGSGRFSLAGPLAPRLLPLLCATGRCVLRRAGQQEEPQPLEWDGGGAWRFEMRVKTEADRFVLDGVLRRGGDERPLDAATLVTSSGLVFMDGRAAPFDHGGAFAWVADLRRHRRLEVPDTGGEKLRAALLSAARRPPVELPEELRCEEVRQAPCPRLTIAARNGGFRGERDLVAEPSFRYGDVIVPAGAPGWAVAAASPRRSTCAMPRPSVPCSSACERSASSARPSQEREAGPLLLSRARLGATVQTLTREGWHVEAEGRLYRRPGATSLRVSSGIDWFDLEASGRLRRPAASACPGSSRPCAAARRPSSSATARSACCPRSGSRRQASLASFGDGRGRARPVQPSQAGLLDALLAGAARGRRRTRPSRRPGERSAASRASRPSTAPAAFVGHAARPTSARASAGCASSASSASAAASPTTWASARPCRCWRSSTRARARGRGRPSLVVVPRSLVFNWTQEAARFAPDAAGARPHRRSTAAERGAAFDELRPRPHDLRHAAPRRGAR